MVDDGIASVRHMLTSLPRPKSFAERRERIDTVASVDGVAPDIVLEPARIRDCPAEWSLAPGSDQSRILLFFHGGGYCSGSIRSHRSMVTEAGRAAGPRRPARDSQVRRDRCGRSRLRHRSGESGRTVLSFICS